MTSRDAFLTLLAAVVMTASATRPAGASDPPSGAWQVLETLREALMTGPRSAAFVQWYLPAGFSTGEEESGTVFLSLPSCLRWDYQTPYEKTFLLCEATLYSWNAGESSGRRVPLESDEEPGLDLLRLRVERLRQRYEARSQPLDDGLVEVVLTPETEDPDLAEARLTVDGRRQLLLGLAYRDWEGNTTRFEIRDYQPLSDPDRFRPPTDIEWLDQ